MKRNLAAVVIALFVFMLIYALLPARSPVKFLVLDDMPAQHFQLENLLRSSYTPEIKFTVLRLIPHQASSFTEGLVYDEGLLYESLGLYMTSHLQISQYDSGNLVRRYFLAPNYFAEGITIIHDLLYQLTYQNHVAMIYDKHNLQLKNIMPYPIEGWGLTNDGNMLIMSDGSATLYFINTEKFSLMRKLLVTSKYKNEIQGLNSLQYINGKIYANVWPTDIIVRISPQSGVIDGWLNLRSIKPKVEFESADNVTNGIAYNANNNSIIVTGKRWPYLAVIRYSN